MKTVRTLHFLGLLQGGVVCKMHIPVSTCKNKSWQMKILKKSNKVYLQKKLSVWCYIIFILLTYPWVQAILSVGQWHQSQRLLQVRRTGLTCTNLPPGFCVWLEEGQKRAAPLLGNVPVDKCTAECPALATGECGRSEISHIFMVRKSYIITVFLWLSGRALR